MTLIPGDPLPLGPLSPGPGTMPICRGTLDPVGRNSWAPGGELSEGCSDQGLPRLWTALFGTPGNDLDRGIKCGKLHPLP